MVDWQITAVTIYCDAVEDEVTVLVHKDWSVKCTGFKWYSEADGASLLKKKGRQLKRTLHCEGPECQRTLKYKEKLQAEEASKDRVRSESQKV